MNPGRPRAAITAAVLLILAAGVWAYWPALFGTWLWDDDQYVTQNLLLRSAGGLARLWFDPVGVNYFPLTATVQWLEWHCWGSNPFGYHAVNLTLHLGSALLTWRLFRQLGLRYAVLGALLLAVHPLAVESVAWISELKNALSLPFGLLALSALIEWDQTGNQSSYYRGLGCFGAAMLAKSTVAMFPGIFVLYLWWRHGRLNRVQALAVIPFFILSVVGGTITLWFEHVHAIGPTAASLEGLGPRIAAAGLALAFYVGKCVWPFGLIPIYPRWTVAPVSFLQLIPWMVFAAVALVSWIRRGTWGRSVLFALGAYLLTVLPILGLVPMAYLRLAWVADHFAYLALVPSIALAVSAIAWIGRLANHPSRGRNMTIGIGLGLAALLAVRTRSYAAVFRTPEALWTYTVRANPGAWSAHNDLGSVHYDAGRLPAAIAEFRRAVELNPHFAEAHNNLGVALLDSHQPALAAAEFTAALQLKPTYASALCNLGNALLIGGRLDEAAVRYRQALQFRPDFREAHYNLGLALRALGETSAAAAQFEQANLRQ